MAEPVYRPADTPKPVAKDIWVVDSGPLYGVVPLRMTVIRLPAGTLLLHSPTSCSPALLAALREIGPIAFLAAPNIAHWMYLLQWQRACPGVVTYAAPGLRRRRQVLRSGVRLDHDLSDTPPPAFGGAIELVVVPGGFGFSEVAFFHTPSRTLVLADLVQNLEVARLPLLVRPLARLLGSAAPHGHAPAHLRAVVKLGGSAARQAAARLVALEPDRVIVAHGRIHDQDAANALRQSLAWLT